MDNKKVKTTIKNIELCNNEMKDKLINNTSIPKLQNECPDKTLKKKIKSRRNNKTKYKTCKIDIFEDTMWWCD